MAGSASSVSNGILDPYWMWPTYEVFEDGRAQASRNDDPASPFHVTYMRTMNQKRVVVFSQLLINILKRFLPENVDLAYAERPAVSVEDLYEVFHLLKRLREQWDDRDNVNAFIHLAHLVRFMETQYAGMPVRSLMLMERRVTFDRLCFFFRFDLVVLYKCHITNETLGARVKSTHDWSTPDGSSRMFSIKLTVYDFDGKNYRSCLITRTIHMYAGDRAFADLPVYPIYMVSNLKAMQERLLVGGRLFQDLMMSSTKRLIQYSGSLFRSTMEASGWSLTTEQIDGRVMIDLKSFRRMNPEYPMGHASPIPEAVDYGPGICEACHPVDPVVAPDELLMLAPGVVYGLSLTANKWGCIAVRYFTEVVFDRNALELLAMDPPTKCIVRALVSGYKVTGSPSHAIFGGLGFVFLCCGEVGQTLTATSVAESLGRPLWALSSEGLGYTPGLLKGSLMNILNVGARWGAVLLLEGADLYLDDVSGGPNSLANMFIRTVTLYPGVLFVSRSPPRTRLLSDVYRIPIERGSVYKIFFIFSCHRKELTLSERKQIWTDLLHQVGLMGDVEDFANEAAEIWNLSIDGIRAAVCLAHRRAHTDAVDLNVQHLWEQLVVMWGFGS